MKILLPLFCVVLLLSCGKPEPPTYLGYDNVRLEKAGLAASVVAASLKFYNPNSYALKLKQADMEVFFNDRFIGRSVLDSLIILPSRDTSFVPLRLQASGKDLLASAAQLLLNPNVRLRVKGTAKVGRGSFFVTIPVDYEGTQRIELQEGEGTPTQQ
jgi:LEA14-like dessication related protein